MPRYQNYLPEPHQQEIHDLIQDTRYAWIMGGFRSGKTRACIEEDVEACVRVPGLIVLITRKFHEDLKTTAKQDFYDITDAMPGLIIKTENDKNIAYFKNGSRVIFQGLYTRTSMQRSKLGGHEYGRIHVEEASEITLNDFLDLQGRLSQTNIPDDERKIYCTTNPPNSDHWAFNTFEVGKKPGLYGIIKVSTKANARYLPANYISDMEGSYANQPGWLSRFFDGNWGFTPKGDPVYHFSDIYLDESISFNSGRPVYRSWDFGWHHPAVVWFQVGPDQDVNILLEKMGSKVYLKKFAPDILALTNSEFPGAEIIDICDDAGKQQKDDGLPSITILQNPPFNLKMRYRQSFVAEGIELVEAKMREMIGGKPALRIKGSKCPILVEGMRGGYCRDGDDIIKDGYYEHVCDALREGFINVLASNSRDRSNTIDASTIRIAQPRYGFNKGVPEMAIINR